MNSEKTREQESNARDGKGAGRLGNAECKRLRQDGIEVVVILDEVEAEATANRPSSTGRVEVGLPESAVNLRRKNLRLEARYLLWGGHS